MCAYTYIYIYIYICFLFLTFCFNSCLTSFLGELLRRVCSRGIWRQRLRYFGAFRLSDMYKFASRLLAEGRPEHANQDLLSFPPSSGTGTPRHGPGTERPSWDAPIGLKPPEALLPPELITCVVLHHVTYDFCSPKKYILPAAVCPLQELRPSLGRPGCRGSTRKQKLTSCV